MTPSPLHHPQPSADSGKWTAAASSSSFSLSNTRAHRHGPANGAEPTRDDLSSFFFFFFLLAALFQLRLPPARRCSFPSHASLHHLAHPGIPAANLSRYFKMCRHTPLSYLHRNRSVFSVGHLLIHPVKLDFLPQFCLQHFLKPMNLTLQLNLEVKK